MSNYFDNQNIWSWDVTDKSVTVTTDHGSHTHTLELTQIPIGEIVDHTGKVMGDAHRAASHDFKELDVEKDIDNPVFIAGENAGIDDDNTNINNDVVEENTSVNNDVVGEDCGEDLDI